MSELIKKLDKAIENSVRKNYTSLLEKAEYAANQGEYEIGWGVTNSGEIDWDRFANYAAPLRCAKELTEKHSFLKWDEKREQRILNTAKVNITARIVENIPKYESKAETSYLEAAKKVVKFLEEI